MQELISNILPGLAGMPNLHPMVVHYPIALLTSFLLLEVLSVLLKSESLKTGASWTLYLGTLGAVAAVLAGFRAAGGIGHDEVIHAIMETHEHLGLTVLLLSVVLSIWRILTKGGLKGTLRLIYLALAFAMVIVMSFGADLGGLMVYTHGVGIKAVESTEGGSHDHNTHDKKEPAIKNIPKEATQSHHDSTPHKH